MGEKLWSDIFPAYKPPPTLHPPSIHLASSEYAILYSNALWTESTKTKFQFTQTILVNCWLVLNHSTITNSCFFRGKLKKFWGASFEAEQGQRCFSMTVADVAALMPRLWRQSWTSGGIRTRITADSLTSWTSHWTAYLAHFSPQRQTIKLAKWRLKLT